MSTKAQAVTFVEEYVPRSIDALIDDLFEALPAILLDGPKGVGKTRTAERRCESVRSLDEVAQLAVVAADPFIIGHDPKPVLIDEYHRYPPVFDAVRRLVDSDNSPGQFLLAGSAPVGASHTGAGRIVPLRMRPLTLFERYHPTGRVSLSGLFSGASQIRGASTLALTDYVTEIVRGGFPGLRHLDPDALRTSLDSYLELIVTRDLPQAGLTLKRPRILSAWLRSYAAATGTTTSWEKLRDAATPGLGDKPSYEATVPYIEILTALRILDPVPAWQPSHNRLKRLTLGDKHHLCDPALAVRLLGLSSKQLLEGNESTGIVIPRDGTLLGALFESLAALSVRTFAQNIGAAAFHMRTKGGEHEVDFIVEADQGVVAIETKLGAAVDESDVKHLHWLGERIGDRLIDRVVLNTGREAFRRNDGVAVVPLALFGP